MEQKRGEQKRGEQKRGFTLVELLIGMAIVGLVAAIGVPAFLTINRHAAAHAAANEFRSIFAECRSRAITRGISAGVKFTKVDGVWMYALYDDGNGDGIRNHDIATGADRMVAPQRRVLKESSLATIGLLPGRIKDPDGDWLTPSRSPVQFNSSTIASFSPLGSATPGSVYLTDRQGEIYAVRLFGTTAKVTLLRYNRGRKRWQTRW